MKGIQISIGFTARLLVTVFVVGLVVILAARYFPEVLSSQSCQYKQSEEINKLINDAASTRSVMIRDFAVESCYEFIDFSLSCDPLETRGKATNNIAELHRCYEALAVGQSGGNCVDDKNRLEAAGRPGHVKVCKDSKDPTCKEYDSCENHKGKIVRMPGSYSSFDIGWDSGDEKLKLEKGKYRVEIGPYSIHFQKSAATDLKVKPLNEKV